MEDLPLQYKAVEERRPEKCGTKRPLEACEEMDDAELRREEYETDESIGRDRRGREAIHEKKQRKYEKKSQKMLTICKNIQRRSSYLH